MVVASHVRIDRGRIEELAAKEQKRLEESTQKSGEMYEWARRTLACGVASSYQVRDPWPIYINEGRGSKVWDVDGNERIDYHNGFGSEVLGTFWFAGLAAVGVVLAAAYLLKMFEKVFLGPVTLEENKGLLDLNAIEIITLLPLLVLMFVIGIFPNLLLNIINPTVEHILAPLASLVR